MASANRLLYNIVKKAIPSSTTDTNKMARLRKLVDSFKTSCEDRDFRRSKATYERTVLRLAAAKQFSMIEDILEHQKTFDDIRHEGFGVRLIYLYGVSGMLVHARKMFDQLPHLNCTRTVKSFNALLKACVDSKDLPKLLEVFEDLPRVISIEPDLVSRNTVIHALCELGSVEDAVSRLVEFESRGTELDVVTFNTILDVLYTRGRFSEGEKVWAMMKSKGIEPDVRSYNAKLQGMFILHDDVKISEAAVELVCEMERNGVKSDSFTYNALIKGFAEKGNVEEAKKCYDKLKKSECRPMLRSSYVTIISACLEAGDLDKALEVSLEAINLGVSLKLTVTKKLIDGLVKKGMSEQASKLEKLVSSKK